MSEHRSERVIEAAARPGWGRLPVAAVVIVSFLLAAIVGMTSAASPWVAGRRRSARRRRAIVGEVLAVGLAAGLCILLGLIWIQHARTHAGEEEAGARDRHRRDRVGPARRAPSS